MDPSLLLNLSILSHPCFPSNRLIRLLSHPWIRLLSLPSRLSIR